MSLGFKSLESLKNIRYTIYNNFFYKQFEELTQTIISAHQTS